MIYGFTTRSKLPRLGKVKLGEKKLSKDESKSKPIALDYFKIVELKDEKWVVSEEVKEVYGEKPKHLRIRFPYDDPKLSFSELLETIFPQSLKRYSDTDTSLKCVGDGRTATLIETGETIECSLECPHYISGKCRPTGRLLFMIDGVKRLGIWEMTLHQRSLMNINSVLRMAKYYFGSIDRSIPFDLRLVQQKVQINGGEQTIWTPSLEPVLGDFNESKYVAA